MVSKIIKFSIEQRWFVLVGVIAFTFFGIYNFQKLPIDAVPDITNIQVQINTEAVGYSPLETEQRITFPVETAMGGLPMLDYTRSISRYGLSQVTVVFKDGTDIYFARQLINERLQAVKGDLPTGLEPTMGPIATGLGEIFMYTLEVEQGAKNQDGKPYSLAELRTIQDWIIKPQLRVVPGVIEVNTIGGYQKQFHILPNPEKMQAYGINLTDILKIVEANNNNVGAGYIERNGEQYLIRSAGRLKTIEDIESIVLQSREGQPIFLKDVARITIGKELRTGAATHNGKEVVFGTVFMLMGENSRIVSKRVTTKIKEINRSLPNGITAHVVYNRTDLVNATIKTVKNNLFEGAALVIIVLFLLLGNIKAALITALVIPLSMLFTVCGMVSSRISGNLMSLGALDFGLIIDGAVIIVENCIRRLSDRQKLEERLLTKKERLAITFEATKEVIRPSFLGVFIIIVVYLPILSLTGVEGKMFHPMAYTVIMALLGAMIFSATFIPAAIAIFLTGKVSEKDNRIMLHAKAIYLPLLTKCLHYPKAVIGVAATLVIFSILLASTMGKEFMPKLDEGDIALHALRIPGTSLTQSIEMQHVLERRLKKFPEVKEVFSKIGTPEIATDPMPPSVADGFVILKSRSKWPNPNKPKDELVSEIENALKDIPGNRYEFTQPIEMRFNELIAGVRADLAVKIFGDDMSALLKAGQEISETLKQIEGASDVGVEQITGLPMMNIELDRESMARYGLNVEDIQRCIQIGFAGVKAGEIFEGDSRFSIILRLPESVRNNSNALGQIMIPITKSDNSEKSTLIPLSQVAKIVTSLGPNQISRENGKRRIVVTANVRGKDLGSFVEEAQHKINKSVNLPTGYWIDWGGQFENLISASKRLWIVVPVALLLIFMLLYITLNSIVDSLLVFTGIPFALTGGIASLWLRGIPLSISSAIGFIALSGIAVLNGLVMITFFNKLRSEGTPLLQAITVGSLTRLRPVLMTAVTDALGFIPMAIALGAGAEVQRPLATVVIGGILSSTALTLLVLPGLYRMAHSRS